MFFIILAEHNAEKQLNETVENLFSQNFSKGSFQIIIADASSADNTDSLADELARKYPENISVFHSKNEDVFQVKNECLLFAKGEYICFWNTDFTAEKNLLAEVDAFLQNNAYASDVVCVPFAPQSGDLTQVTDGWIFQKGNRAVNLFTENRLPLENIRCAFIKTEIARKLCFDRRLKERSFTKFLYEAAECAMQVGLCSTTFVYRKDQSANAVSRENDPEYFLPRVQFLHSDLLKKITAQKGYAPGFLQYLALRDLVFYTKLAQKPLFMTGEECQHFWQVASEILLYIEDRKILEERSLSFISKLWLMKKKYGSLKLVKLRGNIGFAPDGLAPCYFCTDMYIGLDLLEIKDDKTVIDCSVPYVDGIEDEFVPALYVNGKFFHGEYVGRRKYYSAMKEHRCDRLDYKIELPLGGESVDAEFYLFYDDCAIKVRNISTTRFFPVQQRYSKSYYVSGKWRLMLHNQVLNFTKIGKKEHLKSELRFLKELWQKNLLGGRKAVLVRTAYHFLKLFKHKPIWICSDRPEKADDNGEVFFEYLRKEHPEIISYFEQLPTSPDYKRLQKIGPVLEPCSIKHKLKLLLSDWLISSHADFFASLELYSTSAYNDILHCVKTVFLQHGIIKDDLSGWLQKKHHNFRGFITSVEKEYNSIVNGNYGYSSREMWLTGLPRYDKLFDKTQKIITFMPTWRLYLMQTKNPFVHQKDLSDIFKSSHYFRFYHSLFNDQRLLNAAKELGYQFSILPHPQMQKWIKEFSPAPEFVLYGNNRTKSYREVYAESALVITDYSSAIFDFAYLRKPVIYTHFDQKEFFANHTYQQGYFDYERDGFGEVEYDLNSTVERIIEYMKNGCRLKDQYRERIDDFFTFRDRNNCQRIFDKICSCANERITK